MRAALSLVVVLFASALPLGGAHGICPDPATRIFGDGRAVRVEVLGHTVESPDVPAYDGPNHYAHKLWLKSAEGGYSAEVWDSNLVDCNLDGIPGDYDGTLDQGIGGVAFGWGPWADEPICEFGHHIFGGNFAVGDIVFGGNVEVLAGEDDQSGPIIITDPATNEVIACEVDGVISPSIDSDDCLSPVFVGTGTTCGPGGGDGLFWVFFPATGVSTNGGVHVTNPPVAGTVTAF